MTQPPPAEFGPAPDYPFTDPRCRDPLAFYAADIRARLPSLRHDPSQSDLVARCEAWLENCDPGYDPVMDRPAPAAIRPREARPEPRSYYQRPRPTEAERLVRLRQELGEALDKASRTPPNRGLRQIQDRARRLRTEIEAIEDAAEARLVRRLHPEG